MPNRVQASDGLFNVYAVKIKGLCEQRQISYRILGVPADKSKPNLTRIDDLWVIGCFQLSERKLRIEELNTILCCLSAKRIERLDPETGKWSEDFEIIW